MESQIASTCIECTCPFILRTASLIRLRRLFTDRCISFLHLQIIASDLGIAAALYGLYYAGLTWGWAWLVKSYVIPYIIVNFWLVTITYLQHTHPNLPHYEDEEWDWLRGALATVDRR